VRKQAIISAVMVAFLGMTSPGMAAESSRPTPVPSNGPQISLSYDEIVLGGGCFWCVEAVYDDLAGVVSAVSGYMGGAKANPTYEEVSAGGSGHVEVVRIRFDRKIISLEKILDLFWQNIDPTDAGGQFADRGSQYRPVIFVVDEAQKTAVNSSKEAIAKSGRFAKPILVSVEKISNFYAAEDYHQDYHKKNPLRYKYYRTGSGRDQFIKKVWGTNK
jgi:peptide methionine sulfoxide reductase msrA/msrB